MMRAEGNETNEWHTLQVGDAVRRLESDVEYGLDDAEAERRLKEYGTNELEESGIKSPWRILWEQFTAAMVVVLIIAAVVSVLLGDNKDAAAIIVIVILNALMGFRQEYKAEKAIAALKKLAVPDVKVKRGGDVRKVPASSLVPGDVIFLEEGNLVSADCRLLESVNLRVQEAALTGESEPVEKDSALLSDINTPVADRRNMAYLGTIVTYGRGMGIVIKTGMHTELGRIATMIQTVERGLTPLQRRLNQLGRGLAGAALVLVGIVLLLGWIQGGEIRVLFLTGISMAVAAVPEGLPAVVTIALALGSQRMLKRRALIRKLPAVETLGSVTVICSDKTGTLTQNCMSVAVLDVAGGTIDLKSHITGHSCDRTAGEGPHPEFPEALNGAPAMNGLPAMPDKVFAALHLLLMGAALCSDATLKTGKTRESQSTPNGFETAEFEAIGDPTEGALVVAAAEAGLLKSELERCFPRTAEFPFDSDRKRMTTVHRWAIADLPPNCVSGPLEYLVSNVFTRTSTSPGDAGTDSSIPGFPPYLSFTKGAVDSLLEVSAGVLVADHIEPLDREWRERVSAANDRLAQKGMRIIGVAFKQLRSAAPDASEGLCECDLVFIGMAGLIDPARTEAKDAVAVCRKAGIRPVMITGDHPLTAGYIARELGIHSNGGLLTGNDLAQHSADEMEGIVEDVEVYARVSPEHKLNIVEALQKRGHVVAMTGDGVNDAPALKKADIGVAMGITGTDVSKEVADIVLLDDNFATIVAAVEEGRVIFDNVRKFMKYLLSSNTGEILLMLIAPLLGMPLPLLPLQILWINLVTDGLPALALALEPAEKDIMNRPPRHPSESVFAGGMGGYIIWVGIVMGLVPLLAGYWYWMRDDPAWRTIVFNILTLEQMTHVLAVRSSRFSFFSMGMLSNKPLIGAVLLTLLLQISVVYAPYLKEIFMTVELSPKDMAICLLLSTVVFWAVELDKRRLRKKIQTT